MHIFMDLKLFFFLAWWRLLWRPWKILKTSRRRPKIAVRSERVSNWRSCRPRRSTRRRSGPRGRTAIMKITEKPPMESLDLIAFHPLPFLFHQHYDQGFLWPKLWPIDHIPRISITKAGENLRIFLVPEKYIKNFFRISHNVRLA